jgi:hypothetical protein
MPSSFPFASISIRLKPCVYRVADFRDLNRQLVLPVKENEPDAPGVRKSRFALTEGDVVVSFPDNMSADSVEDLDAFWQVFIKKARREATKQ